MLGEALADGRISHDEYSERMSSALSARTLGDLAVLTTDLPAVPAAEGAAVPVPEARQLVRIECGSGSAKRDGRWVVPERIEVRVSSGSVKLDLTRAVISSPTLQVDADVRSGSLVLVTRPGIVVDTDDVAVRSGSVGVKAPRGAGVPAVLRVHVTGQVGSGSLKARPPRRTFWQWLLRRPVSYD